MRIDYNAISDAIRTQLTEDTDLNAGVVPIVFVETPIAFSAEACPAIHIYFEGRQAPADQQRIAAGRRTDFLLNYSLWCKEFHIDSVEEASRKRNHLIALTETALMGDLTLGGTVSYCWIESGDMNFAEDNGFFSVGTIKLTAKGQTRL
jgi:hypothetical protein